MIFYILQVKLKCLSNKKSPTVQTHYSSVSIRFAVRQRISILTKNRSLIGILIRCKIGLPNCFHLATPMISCCDLAQTALSQLLRKLCIITFLAQFKCVTPKKCITPPSYSNVVHMILFKCITLKKSVQMHYSMELFKCITPQYSCASSFRLSIHVQSCMF